MKIEVKALTKPEKRIIDIVCPSCNKTSPTTIPIERYQGRIHCYYCGALLEWREMQ